MNKLTALTLASVLALVSVSSFAGDKKMDASKPAAEQKAPAKKMHHKKHAAKKHHKAMKKAASAAY
ncbi:hypothetical protein [Vogesella sp. LIG4]|uniref:hypothetical protein n=1 Tax=Vogesella sp. LIG4 TaxID=1192162 RepID=UPI00081FAE97|nr:hypothetical protein [Vogesella sp. LIG4]SCK18193.1 hypothetical protein PSELUDRAFT_1960 [Vogesella sp. LIG4]